MTSWMSLYQKQSHISAHTINTDGI